MRLLILRTHTDRFIIVMPPIQSVIYLLVCYTAGLFFLDERMLFLPTARQSTRHRSALISVRPSSSANVPSQCHHSARVRERSARLEMLPDERDDADRSLHVRPHVATPVQR